MSNLHLVTGYAGAAHITPEDHGSLYAGIFGNGSYVLDRGNKLSASAITSNRVRVLDGDMVIHGRHVRLAANTYVDLTIENGAQGVYRNDLIVARYTKNASTGIEECNLVVLKGASVASNPADPAYSDGDLLNDHVAQADFPLYRVALNGLAVELQQLFEVITFVTVGADGKIKSEYLPSMNYIPTSQKGAANGVAPLNEQSAVAIATGGTGATNAADALKNLGALRVEFGNYTGTNSSSTKKLSFNFKPQVVIVSSNLGQETAIFIRGASSCFYNPLRHLGKNAYTELYVTWGENELSWRANATYEFPTYGNAQKTEITVTPLHNLNSGAEFKWIAFGV